MTLLVYKGFGIDFLEQLEERPLVDGDIASKIDVFSFSKKTRKRAVKKTAPSYSFL